MGQRGGSAGSGPELADRISVAGIGVQQLDRNGPGKLDVGCVLHLAELVGCDLMVKPVPSGDQKGGADR